jgi:RHS repeat-associated protein
MAPYSDNLLCRYHYDPLDRLVGTTPLKQNELQRFYCKNRLTTEIQGQVRRSIFQQGDQLLAQQEHQGDTLLLATDQQRSVAQTVSPYQQLPIVYSPYGHRPVESNLLSLLGFNGERSDPLTGHYWLGNGYRTFNPVLMRFNSPDSWSPFGKGGLNGYAYCLGDPVNRMDPTGHAGIWGKLKYIGRKLGLRKSQRVVAARAPEAAMAAPAGLTRRNDRVRVRRAFESNPVTRSRVNGLVQLNTLQESIPKKPDTFLLQHLSQAKLTSADHAFLVKNHSHAWVMARVRESSFINFQNQYKAAQNREHFAVMANQNLLPGVFKADLPENIQKAIRDAGTLPAAEEAQRYRPRFGVRLPPVD